VNELFWSGSRRRVFGGSISKSLMPIETVAEDFIDGRRIRLAADMRLVAA
jgi:hypothetical protein